MSKVNDHTNVEDLLNKFINEKNTMLKENKKIPEGFIYNIEKWISIISEVYSRKKLLSSAIKDLENGEQFKKNCHLLAVTDVFVEKAQNLLTSRGRYLYALGFLSVLIGVIILISYSIFIVNMDSSKEIDHLIKAKNYEYQYLTIYLMKATTVTAIVVGVSVYLFNLSKSFLHEGTLLFHRRHSLRFGRLFVYLAEAEDISLNELERAFRWNEEYSTAFKEIKTEIRTPASKFADLPHTLASAWKQRGAKKS